MTKYPEDSVFLLLKWPGFSLLLVFNSNLFAYYFHKGIMYILGHILSISTHINTAVLVEKDSHHLLAMKLDVVLHILCCGFLLPNRSIS